MSEVQYWQVIAQAVTAIVAIVAFLLSFFNFYWSNLRQRRALFFIRVLTPSTFLSQPQFALVNGSNRDVLITGIHCCFLDKDGKGYAYPEQTLVVSNGSEMQMLLESGKAIQYWIKLPDKFETGFHLQGEYQKNLNGAYLRQMNIDVQWVDNRGKPHQSIVPFEITGFSSDDRRTISKSVPGISREVGLNLYDESVHLSENIFG